MQENVFGAETETVRKSWKQITATYPGKGYSQEDDVEPSSVFDNLYCIKDNF